MPEPAHEAALADDPLLNEQFRPIWPWLRGRTAVEISINEPGRVWVQDAEKGYELFRRAPEVTTEWARRLCKYLANYNGLGFHDDLPVLACRIPGGHRFHAVLGRENVVSGIAISIRLKRDLKVTAEDYGWSPGRDFSTGLSRPVESDRPAGGRPEDSPGRLEWILDQVAGGAPVMVAGGTASGKTTFVNQILLPAIPAHHRVITIEDTQELYPGHHNRVQLLVNRVEGRNKVTYRHMIDSVLRLNPDTVILGELSVDNALAALRLLNIGHRSFLTTVHANTPLDALDVFRRNIQLTGQPVRDTLSFLSRTLGGVIQLVHDGQARKIAAIARAADLPWHQLIDDSAVSAARAAETAQRSAEPPLRADSAAAPAGLARDAAE